jgi:hypothetical protein
MSTSPTFPPAQDSCSESQVSEGQGLKRNRWRYQEADSSRDLRIDFMRGIAMAVVIIDHIDIPNLYYLLTHERIGVLTAAEMFIFLSGIIVGIIYSKRIVKDGWKPVARKLFRRGLQLYVVTLCVVILVYLVRFVPLLDSRVLNTYTDTQHNIVYDLYENPSGSRLAFVRDILMLHNGPGQFNIMGLYVVLMFAAPFILWLLVHRRVWLLLLLSGAAYLYNQSNPTRLSAAQFENSFLLLSWQWLFVLGIAAGFYRERLLAFARGKYGRWAIGACFLVFGLLMFYTLNNPWTIVPYDMRLTIIPEDSFNQIYALFFSRLRLGIGRTLNVIVVFVVGCTLLTRYWAVANRFIGWLLLPIGQATLYVFVIHLFFVMLMANIPLFQQGSIEVNTLGVTLVLLTIWLMVRKRFLFRIIPR